MRHFDHLQGMPIRLRLPLSIMGFTMIVVTGLMVLAQGSAPEAIDQVDLLVFGTFCVVLSALLGRALARSVLSPLREFGRSMEFVSRHNHDQPIAGLDRRDEFVALATILKDFQDRLRQAEGAEEQRRIIQAEQEMVVARLGQGLMRLSQGDLEAKIEAHFPAAYDTLRADFNASCATLAGIVASLVERARSIHHRSLEITGASDDLSRRTESQAAALEETAAALGELTSSVATAAARAAEVESVVGAAKAEAQSNGKVVSDAVLAMSEIKRSSDEISQIVGVIDDIAFQTNLLALNAGVEAARAGEAGRGFAVVAAEVRLLAQRSSEAANKIKGLIEDSARQVHEGVSLVGRAGAALNSIVGRVSDISSLVSEIADGAKEQSVGLGEINTAMTQLDQVTQENAAMVEESASASHVLSQDAAQLGEIVARFRVTVQGPETPSSARVEKPAPRHSSPPATAGRAVANGGWEEF